MSQFRLGILQDSSGQRSVSVEFRGTVENRMTASAVVVEKVL